MSDTREETTADIDARLADALATAGRSALGMPSSVDTFKAMLDQAGLALVLAVHAGGGDE